jgi:hypothetical protein
MRADWHISGGCWIGLLAAFVMGGTVSAQTGTIPLQESGSSTALQTYRQELASLLQERRSLVSEGATQQQLQAWRRQNAPQLQALQQLAAQLGSPPSLQPKPTTQQANIPANASSTLADFLTNRASLANARAQIYNQLLQTLPQNPSQEQIGAMMQEQRQIFQQQHAGDLQLQAQRAQALAGELASGPLPVPGPVVFPPNATPQLQAFLTARNRLAHDRAQFSNQYSGADPTVRQAAMQQWRQRNASQFEQLRELAQDLSISTPIQEGQN